MKKVELLAPAGSFEALRAAVQNGCDALYLGGASFGARAFANNFDEEEMAQAIAYAHTYGVRVYVTVNTLLKEDEIEACLSYVKQLQAQDVDALIIQDIGLFTLLHKVFPDLELHASTQMHVHNPQGIEVLKEMGASRVVLPRETSIEEIREYSKLGMDLEVFVQGALCVSYSGQCLMSSITLQRSGNRGECAQNCRMRYSLEKQTPQGKEILETKGDYLLSPKDLNTLALVPQLIEANIASFKIEGRMKRSEYVGYMVACYRKAIDAYYNNETFIIDKAMQTDMEKIFNRGFTSGHIFHQIGSRLMNPIRPNHMGIEIGTVQSVTKDKMRILLTSPLYQGDGIRVLNEREDEGFRVNKIYKNGLLVNHGDVSDVIELDKQAFIAKGSKVLKTSDVKQLKEIQETYMNNLRRVEISATFQMQIGKVASLSVQDDEGMHVRVESSVLVEKALKSALEEERIEAQLRKSKDTPFDFKAINFEVDVQSTMPIKEINQMRREALDKLLTLRKQRHGVRRTCDCPTLPSIRMPESSPIYVVVHSEEQFRVCKQANIEHIFVNGGALAKKLIKEGAKERLPRVMKHEYHHHFEMIQEIGGLKEDRAFISDTSLNVTNAYSASFLFSHKASGVLFSLESSIDECIQIINAYHEQTKTYGNFIYPIYGRIELMISEYCVIHAVEKDSDTKACGLCRGSNSYALLDMKKRKYPLLCDEDCRMHILNEDARNDIHKMAQLKQHHMTSFLCVFTNENEQETRDIIRALKVEMERT
ncbi:MAG: U32 family peptidase [Longicatena sp.]